MIILYRLTSFVVALISIIGFLLLIKGVAHPVVIVFATVFLCAIIIARLLGWQVRTFQFWHLLGTPALFLLATFGSLFLLETPVVQIGLGALATILLFIFVEHVFSFIHLPTQYQPFTLEYLSQLLHVLSVFFLATLGFGLLLFLQIPLWLLCLLFFPFLFFIVYGTLWAGKVDARLARSYALASAVLITEFFAVISFFPTGFYTNAAFLALGVYVLLGLSRADALHKLSKEVLRRYVLLFILLTVVIVVTSQWI
jgi:hypothetical protein